MEKLKIHVVHIRAEVANRLFVFSYFQRPIHAPIDWHIQYLRRANNTIIKCKIIAMSLIKGKTIAANNNKCII